MRNFSKLIIYSLILSLTVNIIYFRYIDKSKLKQLFGYSCLKVVTGSMEPEIKAGENIVIKKCNKYEVGDIITYIEKNGCLVTHRIIDIYGEEFYTKGDANNAQDLEPVTIDQICGKVIFHFNSFFDNQIFSLAKFISSNKARVNVQIAKPIFIVEGDEEIFIENSKNFNNYNFSVKNYNDNYISEVSMNYNIDIIADDNVKTKLFYNDNLVDIDNTFTLPHGVSIEREYSLLIEAPEGYFGKVKINVYAYQIEEG